MATVINNPGEGGSSAAGWAVAVIILIAVILIGLFVWPGYAKPVQQEPAGINVDVNLPTTGGDQQGGTDSGAQQ